jgi:hypothetical protein
MIAGNDQYGRVSQVLPEPLVVRVVDVDHAPVAGIGVVWVAHGGGSVDPERVRTDSEGHALALRLLGPTAGDQTTTATVSGLETVLFTTTAVAED